MVANPFLGEESMSVARQSWLKCTARLAICGGALAVFSLGVAQAKDATATAVPGKPALLLGTFDVKDLGYDVNEFFVSGDAVSYSMDEPASQNGHWAAAPSGKAHYTTRIVVVCPKDAQKFNGTVVVEWLNVSGGVDGAADWFMAHREMVRSGMAYVGVSAQKVGVEGGPNMMGTDNSLKKTDPARYGSLSHPGDAFAYDIYTQAGRLVRAARPGGLLGPLTPKRVIAMGESQSAAFMTTYVNAVDPLAKVYNGFLIHSRGSGVAPLGGGSLFGGGPDNRPQKVKLRADLRVPVITFITETDLIGIRGPGFYAARQPDTEHLRIWEVPGTSHADNYTIQVSLIDSGSAPVEKLAAAYAPTASLMGTQLPKTINFAPQHHYVLEAALWSLDRWVRSGHAPPKALPIELTNSDPPAAVRDGNGLAVGGIRTPWVDVPAARLSGLPTTTTNVMAVLFGTSEPFDATTLVKLYPGGKVEYLKRFEASLDSSIKAGFILPADRGEILSLAALMYPGGAN
jgi:hypothetical protein